jgi:hypothetical protein
MIWALLALLGIPIWFIAAILIAAFRSRKTIRSNPDVFAYKLGKNDKWQRGSGYARWVSDVVVFHAGIALIRSDAVHVTAMETLDTVDLPSKGLGDNPTAVTFTYAAGTTATIAVSDQSLELATGPKSGPTS